MVKWQLVHSSLAGGAEAAQKEEPEVRCVGLPLHASDLLGQSLGCALPAEEKPGAFQSESQ